MASVETEAFDFADILQSIPSLLLVVRPDGTVAFCNRPLRNLEPSQVIGRSLVELTPEEHRAEIADQLAKVFAGSEAITLEQPWFAGESGGRRWYENAFTPIVRGGKVVAVALLSTEITGRKYDEERVRLMRDQLDYAQVLAQLGSWSWEIGSSAISWSAELYRLHGLNPRHGISLEQYVSTIHPDDRDRVRAIIDRAAKDSQPAEFEHRMIRSDGEERLLHCRLFVSPSVRGRRPVMYGTARDVTEQRRAELERERLFHQAEGAIAARDAFLSMAAHELKTPLTTLRLHLDSAIHRVETVDHLSDRERLVRKLETAKRQAKRVASLLEVLLEVPDLLSRDLSLVREPADLSQVVRMVAGRMSPELSRQGCELRLALEDGVVGHWDPRRLEQLISQLLSNAIKFGRGKPIEIELIADPQRAHLTVRDAGIGIRPEDRERIFERFTRAASERHYGGLGLGLWVVKQIADALGGAVEVHSEPGRGAAFTVHLPRAIEALEPRPRAVEPEPQFLAEGPDASRTPAN